MAGDPKYMEKCAKDHNGQVLLNKGSKSLPAKQSHADLDKPIVGSRSGVLKKGR